MKQKKYMTKEEEIKYISKQAGAKINAVRKDFEAKERRQKIKEANNKKLIELKTKFVKKNITATFTKDQYLYLVMKANEYYATIPSLLRKLVNQAIAEEEYEKQQKEEAITKSIKNK